MPPLLYVSSVFVISQKLSSHTKSLVQIKVQNVECGPIVYVIGTDSISKLAIVYVIGIDSISKLAKSETRDYAVLCIDIAHEKNIKVCIVRNIFPFGSILKKLNVPCQKL